MQELTLWEKKSMCTDIVSVHDQLRKFRIKISKGWNIQQPRISINLLQVSVYSTLHSMVSLIECYSKVPIIRMVQLAESAVQS